MKDPSAQSHRSRHHSKLKLLISQNLKEGWAARACKDRQHKLKVCFSWEMRTSRAFKWRNSDKNQFLWKTLLNLPLSCEKRSYRSLCHLKNSILERVINSRRRSSTKLFSKSTTETQKSKCIRFFWEIWTSNNTAIDFWTFLPAMAWITRPIQVIHLGKRGIHWIWSKTWL